MKKINVIISGDARFYTEISEDEEKIPIMVKNLVELAKFHLKYVYPNLEFIVESDLNYIQNSDKVESDESETSVDESLLEEIRHALREITTLYYTEELWSDKVVIHRIYRKLMFTTISIHKYTRHQLNLQKTQLKLKSVDEVIQKLFDRINIEQNYVPSFSDIVPNDELFEGFDPDNKTNSLNEVIQKILKKSETI